jgi:hypothetical protein
VLKNASDAETVKKNVTSYQKTVLDFVRKIANSAVEGSEYRKLWRNSHKKTHILKLG